MSRIVNRTTETSLVIAHWWASQSNPLWRQLAGWSGRALNLLFPPHCTYCLSDMATPSVQPWVCSTCQAKLIEQLGSLCPRCGVPVAETSCQPDCVRCRNRRLRFHTVVPLGLYRGEMRRAVVRMKQPRDEPLAAAMGHLMADRLGSGLKRLQPDLVVPMPIHWMRRVGRGANSPEIVARPLARRLQVPVTTRLLAVRRRVRKQGTLSPTERFSNIRGIFSVTTRYDIEGTNIVLVDDVMTTGATASEAARMLRAAGAAKVVVTVVARAVG